MLNVANLQSGYGESMVLRDLSIRVEPGQVVCLLGRNGVGKTTLLKTIMGLIRSKKGIVEWNGKEITRHSPDRRAIAGIGYVPQGRDIFPQLTVEENLLLGLEASDRRGRQIPASLYDMFPVLKEMLQRKGGDLSGGQQQQLALARALAAEPRLLLLDEPMEGIQPSIVHLIEDLLFSLKAEKRMSLLLVEQSLEFAASIADYIYVVDRGTVVEEGPSGELGAEEVRRHLVV